jgi:hypothetical protein
MEYNNFGGGQMAKLITVCPVCGKKLSVEKLKCHSCGLEIKGDFEMDDLFRLSDEQLDFVKIFIKNEGNITEVGKELGISYPTVKSKLRNVIKAMGYSVKSSKDYVSKDLILQKVENGEITVEEAAKILKEGSYE